MNPDYPPRIVGISPKEIWCFLQLHTGDTILLDMSYASLEVLFQKGGFPSIPDLIDRKRIVAYPLPLHMSAEEWKAISLILQSSDEFRAIAAKCPTLRNQIRLCYQCLGRLPQRLYGGVGIWLDGQGLAEFYTSLPVNFQRNKEKGTGWYSAMLSADADRLIRTFVNIETHEVVADLENHPGHFVTNMFSV